MKKIFVLIAAVLGLISCKNTNSPDITATKFLNSMYAMDYETAKSISTKNTWNIINILAQKTKHITAEEKSELIGRLKVTITETVPESDSTVLVYYTTDPDFQIFPVLRILMQEDQDGKIKYKIDNSSLDSISGGDALIFTEEVKPFEEDTVMTVEPTE